MNHILIIGLIWPEPSSTAAGVRILQLISALRYYNFKITFVSTAKLNERSYNLNTLGINTKEIKLNDSSFDVFIREINPNIVMFDRFITEEQFGWRVIESLPNALRILNTEDLHGLRNSRLLSYQKQQEYNIDNLKGNEVFHREVASIYRCDLSLIISSYEYQLLCDKINIPKDLLFYLPFMIDKAKIKNSSELRSFEDREHLVMIGNYKHLPNWRSLLFIKQKIWPIIHKESPKLEFHYYGAYTDQKVKNLENKQDKFLCKGSCDNSQEMLETAKICLAPLVFGAGLKGKFFDAMLSGTPSVTNGVGIEGISDCRHWSGLVSENPHEIAAHCIDLYYNKERWLERQNKRIPILRNFSSDEFQAIFYNKIIEIQLKLDEHRSQNIIGTILIKNQYNANKYLSKWIEVKSV